MREVSNGMVQLNKETKKVLLNKEILRQKAWSAGRYRQVRALLEKADTSSQLPFFWL